MDCPRCGDKCDRDSVHNGVAMLFGPWGCHCGWSENEEYDQKDGPLIDEKGGVTDQFGLYYPPKNLRAILTRKLKKTKEK